MGHRGRRIAIAAAIVGCSSLTAGVVIAGTGADDDTALQPTRGSADRGIERKVDQLVGRMTLDEKLQQVQLLADNQVSEDDARKGVGGVFSLVDPAKIDALQHVAVEQSRLHIPILFAYDTIHGYRTTFPIPLAQASSFDPDVPTADNTISARETAAVGIKQIYAPMVDVSHEPRWGRISEGAGEDPYLGSVFAAARVRAAQGSDYSAADKVVTSPKHMAAYGNPEGGRDYNTTDVSEQRLRNLFLPPFKAAIDAGADTVMCSFNAINGEPGCANSHLETDILKQEWGFDGFIESDYTAVDELRACPPKSPDQGSCGHGVAADGPSAGALALNAGTDSEMVSKNIRDNGKQLLSSGQITSKRLDDAVRRILRVKFRAGLFDHPYVDQAAIAGKTLQPDDRAAARKAAGRSMVLLKNDDNTLPLDPGKSVAVIGPLGDDQHDMLGPWWGQGKDEDAVSVFTGIKAQNPNTTFTEGCKMIDNDLYDPANECGSDAGFAAAVDAAKAADQVVLALGETRGQSGEAESRSVLDLPGRQQDLIDAIKATGKPFTVVLFNGRPLTLGKVADASPAILEAWFPGIEAGNAVADVLFGKVNPGGKLPVSFPQSVGQVPIYYNHDPTGRPCDATSKYNSRYRDLKTCAPLYPFGYGLSYTSFKIDNLQLSTESMSQRGSVMASVDVQNTGSRAGDEVVQLYLHDPVASLSQPVRRLRGFQRVTLDAGQKKTVTFRLDAGDVGFYDNSGRFTVEPGQIDVFAGDSSSAELSDSFTVTGKG
ncbi:MAG TPA: beta-glucosidase BglX [Baekduia sp.]|uniref:beta-glucosidase BglX n=1 Tax=Baekduia sp. TaxID=2600305 RepID=UPI002CE3EA64|nr:beta-glucosidase BglX [Baekduia sp.]HMJ32789.1 beta-glucosidase BglX [Baekduia sp.]